MASQPASVGRGIKRMPRAKPVKLPVNPDTTPLEEAKLGGADSGDWTGTAEVAGMLNEPGAYKLAKREALVLNLALAPDLERYNDILTRSAMESGNILVISEEKKYVEEIQNWKVFLTIQHVVFKKLFKKGKKPDTLAAQEALQQTIL